MPNIHPFKFRAARAALIFGLASIALSSAGQAAVTVLSLSGDPTAGSYASFDIGSKHYQTFVLDLGLETPFTLNSGDEIQTTISLSSVLAVPGADDYQFLGVNFNGSTGPSGAATTGTFTFAGLTGSVPNPTTSNNCGNCLTDLYGQPGAGSFSFTGLYADTSVVSLDEPFTVTGVSLSYQVDSFGSAAPEPAAWAMLLIGFGVIGTMMRSRRQVGFVA